MYLTSLGGSSHYGTTGVTSIYFAANNSFRLYLRFSNDAALTPALANSYGWHVNWVAVNGNVQAVKKYYTAGSQRIALRDNGQLRWLLGDHLDSTSYAATGTTEQGEVRYKPWGAGARWARYSSGSIPTTYRYTGQREEASLGLYYYGARWYDPALGRFIQPDTIVPNPGDAKTFDRFAYVNNNPLRYNDPTGHYKGDVHETLTYQIAFGTIGYMNSLFNLNVDAKEVAKQIAQADVGTDNNGATAPLHPVNMSLPVL